MRGRQLSDSGPGADFWAGPRMEGRLNYILALLVIDEQRSDRKHCLSTKVSTSTIVCPHGRNLLVDRATGRVRLALRQQRD